MASCKYYDCGYCYAPKDIKSNDVKGACIEPEYCPYLKSQMTEKERIEGEIKILQKKLALIEELEKTKSPVKEAFKRVYGYYPKDRENGVWTISWSVFQDGYNAAKEEEPEDTEWKSVALRFGEELSDVGPCGYYQFTAEEWLEWALNECKKEEQEVEPSMTNCVITGNPPDGYVTWQEWYNELGSKGILHNLRISSIESIEQEVREWDVVRESVKWYPGKDPLDCLKPQTPEQVSDGLKEAFREAIKQGVVSSTKPQTLYDLIGEFLNEIDYLYNTDTEKEYFLGKFEEWLPKPQSAAGSQNAYVECTVEGFNDCLDKIKRKLR